MSVGSRFVVGFLLVAVATGCTGTPTATPGPTQSSAAIGQPSQAPIASTTPAATASATPGVRPTPTAVRSAIPSRTPVDPQLLIERFFSDFAEANPPFHVVIDVLITESVVGVADYGATARLEGDAWGTDFTGSMRSEQAPEINQDLVFLDDETYVRFAGGEWFMTPAFGQAQPINPAVGLTVDDILYRGVRPSTGLNTLEITRLVGIRKRAIPLRRATFDLAQFEIDVTDDGVPVSARLDFLVSGYDRGDLAFVVYNLDYEFSEVGVPVTIEAPI